jgi:ribosome biogenesis GTPase A
MGEQTKPSVAVQWFPGHMTKALRTIEKDLKLIDVFAELTDARLPESGRNPILSQIVGNKPHVLLLNKRDYADLAATALWLDYYKSKGIAAIACDCRSGAGLEKLPVLLKKVVGERKYGGAIRVMAAGIPNSGKSSFLNRMAGGKKAAVGDKPGVTRGKQWVKAPGGKFARSGSAIDLEVLDLPGILPPKIENKQAALYLAYTGAVRDEVMDVHALGASLAEFLATHHADKLVARYKLSDVSQDGMVLLKLIAQSRSMRISGGEFDTERAANALLDDFRGCRIGKVTLELPPSLSVDG